MSVYQTHYAVLGMKFSIKKLQKELECEDIYQSLFKSYEDDGHTEKVHSKNGLTSIFDGMNGDYVIIGKVLAKGTWETGLPMTKISYSEDKKAVIAKAITRNFNLTGKVELYVFTHFH